METKTEYDLGEIEVAGIPNIANIVSQMSQILSSSQQNIAIKLGKLQGLYTKLKEKIGYETDIVKQQEQLEKEIEEQLFGEDSTYENLINIFNNDRTLRTKINTLYLMEITRMGRPDELDFILELAPIAPNYIYFLASILCTNHADYTRMKEISLTEEEVRNLVNRMCGAKRVRPFSPELSEGEKQKKYRMSARERQFGLKGEQYRRLRDEMTGDEAVKWMREQELRGGRKIRRKTRKNRKNKTKRMRRRKSRRH
jgi:hypothetical protein